MAASSPARRRRCAPNSSGRSRELGINYLLTYLFLGTMSLNDAMRSLDLFRTEVMPHLAKL